ncbi:hypothetical protein [Shinella zoogloeoides]|uniref:hypothetical protein n=1 Tax=Shinella zoogloeoides TaxID=352475 RepID=UPI001F58A009|nr:hypothetical protein [Shinella zoogloeoides]
MKSVLAVGIATCLAFGHAHAAGSEISIDGIAFEDVVEIPTNKLLLRPLGVSPDDVNLYCSPTWAGSIAVIEGVAIALNPIANKAAKKNSALRINGSRVDFVSTGAKRSPLKNEPDTVARLVARTDRDCVKNEKAAPEEAAKSPPLRTKQENVLNHIAEVMVIDELCDRLEINTVFVSLAATYNGVNAQDIASGGRYHDALVSLVRNKRTEMLQIGADEDLVCASGELLYGESGMNVKGLLISAY